MFTSLPNTTLAWLAAMIAQDEEEQFEKELSLLEYLASFTSPEAVQQVRMARNGERVVSQEDDFKRAIETISGRPAPKLKDE